jgi:bifunctional non-homologous end joining protein LigD
VVASRLDSPYRPGVRTAAWVKTRHFDRGRFDLLGVTPTPEEHYALIPGVRSSDGRLHYAGRVEWGFTRELQGVRRPGAADGQESLRRWTPTGAVLFGPGVVAEVRYLRGAICAILRFWPSITGPARALTVVGVAAGHPSAQCWSFT